MVRYLQFIGYSVEIFNVGNVRREMGYSQMDASFFDRDNEAANKLRYDILLYIFLSIYLYMYLSISFLFFFLI